MDELTPLTKPEIARYSRHLILEGFGVEGQRRLKAASVLCVGTGGLGAPALTYLAAAGVGRLGVVDFDVVDASNLQRQIIHGSSSVGRPKVSSALERIAELNPLVRVEIFDTRLDRGNALEILGGFDIVIDGTDNFPTRYLIGDACELLGKPYIYGSVSGFEGQASVFNYQGGPTYRDLFPEPPRPGLVPSCAEGGILGVLPGLIGTIQATEAIKIIVGLGSTLSGRLLLYDAAEMSFRELKIRRRPDAVAVTELVDYDALCGIPVAAAEATRRASGVEEISVCEARARLDAGWRPFVLDVREPGEAEIVSLEFTDRLCPYDEVTALAPELPGDRDVLVYCRTGRRSALACASLAEAGLSRALNLAGGIVAWAEQIDPTMATY